MTLSTQHAGEARGDRYPTRLLVRIDLRGAFYFELDRLYWKQVRENYLLSYPGQCFWVRNDLNYTGHRSIKGTFVTLPRQRIIAWLPPHGSMSLDDQLLFKTLYLDREPVPHKRNHSSALIELGYLHGGRPTVYGYNSYFLSAFNLPTT